MPFSLIIDKRAFQDIQEAIDYYEEQQVGLGKKFVSALNNHLKILEKSPFFSIRYDEVRCIPLKKFPFMVHFTIDEDQQRITIWGVFHTSLDPKKWQSRR